MEAMRQSWSDDRLDDLNRRVDDGFRDLRAEIRGVRGEVSGLRAEIHEGRRHVDDRFDRLNQTLMVIGGGLIATSFATCASLVANLA
jgi:hypothetical protein